MVTSATKQDIRDIGGIIQNLATEVSQRFDGVDRRLDLRFVTIEDRLDKIGAQIADLHSDFSSMLDLLDAHTKRLDDFIKEMLARDARVDRLERWIKVLAEKAGIELSYLWGEMTERKDAVRVLEFLQAIRARYPSSVRIYLVMDNLSTHWTPDIRRWARKSRTTLVPTPTYASYLNRIECHFWALAEFCIRHSDYPDHLALEKAVMDHIAYRNAHREDARILRLVSRRKVA